MPPSDGANHRRIESEIRRPLGEVREANGASGCAGAIIVVKGSKKSGGPASLPSLRVGNQLAQMSYPPGQCALSGQQPAKRPACGRLELSGTYLAVFVWISSLEPLFDHRKVLVLAQRAIVVWISRRELVMRQTTVQLLEI